MAENPRNLNSKNLVPFKRRRSVYRLPVLTREEGEKIIDDVDPELRPDEQNFVRHYLGYADVMLKSAEDETVPPKNASPAPDNVTEMPAPEKDNKKDKDNAA
jgi:hypothetical protein